ncbi:(S)-ureidoglycine aminohydrolase [Babesia caballi]|uniref:(S)-ureidoglycine aminohydrolase n=1 Tax=Babesia caballi TaxID=5871 RepID=A0AAV4LM80_BABCB|nr:(S)-ureidoglycine aminohydrolase [Babesia caballi]
MTTNARPRRTLIVRSVIRLQHSNKEVGAVVCGGGEGVAGVEGVVELPKRAVTTVINWAYILVKPLSLTTKPLVSHVNGMIAILLPNVGHQSFKLGLQVLNLSIKAIISRRNVPVTLHLLQHFLEIVLNFGGKSTHIVLTREASNIFHRIHDLLNVTIGINLPKLGLNRSKRLHQSLILPPTATSPPYPPPTNANQSIASLRFSGGVVRGIMKASVSPSSN